MVTIQRDIQYVSSLPPNAKPLSQSLDLYLPPSSVSSPLSSPPPLILYIHGGLWMDRDKSDYTSLASHWATLGLPTAVLNYRQTSHEDGDPSSVIHPSHTQDVAAAVRFLSSYTSPHFDSTRLVLFGHSCGAHMAGLLTSSPLFSPLPPPVACIGLQGLYNVSAYAAAHPNWSSDLLKVFPTFDDPTSYPPSTVPWLVLHSVDDQWVEVGQSEGWVEHMRGGARLERMEGGGGHWGVAERIGSEEDLVTDRMLAFLKELIDH